MRMLETRAAIPLLYPGLYRELLYWLLTGSGGEQLLHTVVASSRENRLIAAIHYLKTRFAEAVQVDELATIACMSSATFHSHFNIKRSYACWRHGGSCSKTVQTLRLSQ
jgi:transcriptional regulator GlxA family with amidase domain